MIDGMIFWFCFASFMAVFGMSALTLLSLMEGPIKGNQVTSDDLGPQSMSFDKAS